MKLVLQSILISVAVHFVYFAASIIYGLILTKRHVQDISAAYDNVQYLQNEVVFGYAGSTPFFLLSFLIVVALSAIAITILKRVRTYKLS